MERSMSDYFVVVFHSIAHFRALMSVADAKLEVRLGMQRRGTAMFAESFGADGAAEEIRDREVGHMIGHMTYPRRHGS